MYTHFARQFLERVSEEEEEEGRVQYWEYARPMWTFHGKGVWLYPAGEEWPVATLVGSSNYGVLLWGCGNGNALSALSSPPKAIDH